MNRTLSSGTTQTTRQQWCGIKNGIKDSIVSATTPPGPGITENSMQNITSFETSHHRSPK